MAKMYHRPGPPASGQKVFLATPAYQGLSAGYTFALFHSSKALSDAGIGVEVAIFSGDCHVDDARNRLVRDFLETDCTDLVFLDTDLRWEPADLVSLCRQDRDVVAATYPLKQEEESFPVRFLNEEIWSDRDGLIEVEAVPTGFLRIRRHVLEGLAEKARKFKPKSDTRGKIPLIFERQLDGEARWGGDYTFCRKWRATGGRIYVMPEIVIEHTGDRDWKGSLGSWLRRKSGVAITHGLQAIRDGKDTPETFDDIVAGWANPWSVGADFLYVAAVLARKATGPIVECGSGVSSLVMAAANPDIDVWSLEHDEAWLERVRKYAPGNLRLIHAPLKNGWYSVPKGMPERFSLAVVDGPPRYISDRSRAFGLDADMWMIDDINSPTTSAMVSKFCAGMERSDIGRFAIVRKAA